MQVLRCVETGVSYSSEGSGKPCQEKCAWPLPARLLLSLAWTAEPEVSGVVSHQGFPWRCEMWLGPLLCTPCWVAVTCWGSLPSLSSCLRLFLGQNPHLYCSLHLSCRRCWPAVRALCAAVFLDGLHQVSFPVYLPATSQWEPERPWVLTLFPLVWLRHLQAKLGFRVFKYS